jgi:trehalose 6-phosphate phosphatase
VHALQQPEIDSRCRTAPHLFVTLGYDGTLVPIAPHPEHAHPTPALLALLARLVQTPSVQVAVVSGRPLSQLCSLVPVAGMAYVGSHGLEICSARGEVRFLFPPSAFLGIMTQLRRALSPLLFAIPDLVLESKGYALALHYRQAPAHEAERAVSEFLATVQAYRHKGVEVEVLHGKKVVEIRPLGANTGKAVRALVARAGQTTLPIHIGGDATDEDAFRALNGWGLTILVAKRPRPTAAQYYLKDPTEVFAFLSHVLSLRCDAPPDS